jgi:hypothetical protein
VIAEGFAWADERKVADIGEIWAQSYGERTVLTPVVAAIRPVLPFGGAVTRILVAGAWRQLIAYLSALDCALTRRPWTAFRGTAAMGSACSLRWSNHDPQEFHMGNDPGYQAGYVIGRLIGYGLCLAVVVGLVVLVVWLLVRKPRNRGGQSSYPPHQGYPPGYYPPPHQNLPPGYGQPPGGNGPPPGYGPPPRPTGPPQ